jgi:signal transduction histidine kinase
MKLLRSITNRIFLASAALAVLSIGAAVFFVSRTITARAEAELQRGLLEAGTLVDQQCATLVETLTVMARLVADDPRLKAAVDTGDPPTVQPLADQYRNQLNAALLVLTGKDGAVLAHGGGLEVLQGAIGALPEIQDALAGRESNGFWPQAEGVVRVVTVPITIGIDRPEIMGTLTLGFRLDNALAAQFKRATESDIAFAVGGEIRASTLPAADRARLRPLLSAETVQSVPLDSGEYVALRRPLATEPGANLTEGAPWVLLLRSRTERLRFLDAIRTALASVAVVAVLAATILSYAVARTITRPLATITDAMKEMSATGDLTRKIRLADTRWEDEDAKLLATTFNTLTDSIERFQREGAQRERLSALGRLSTVIAHEIRNPLMIIKASLRTLARDTVSRDDIRQAMKDVDEEVGRLNRVVNDVLDFARPIDFELAPADLNALCVEAEQATRAAAPETTAVVRLDPTLGPVVTDAERLRTALVNILTNARHAAAARVQAGGRVSQAMPDIEIESSASPLRITISDRGIGVRSEDMPRVFDPYFTTKRTGTGLGLAIAKNIIEGLGGSLAMESRPGAGTVIQIDLPTTTDMATHDRDEHPAEVRT